MSYYNYGATVARRLHIRAVNRPRILSLYRLLLKEVATFNAETNRWDPNLADKLVNETKRDFKGLKHDESLPKKVTKLLATKRELYYDLRDANSTFDRAEENPDSREK